MELGFIVLGALFCIFAVGGFIADYILPCVPVVDDYINSLPSMQSNSTMKGGESDEGG